MASPMEHPIRSLHHVTVTVDDAQQDLDFCLDVLGLRLVKTTVNFDNHNVYHFYYGDEVGTPGTIWTTFPYKGWGVPVGIKGVGQIGVTSFSVPEGSLPFWKARLAAHGIAVEDVPPRFGDPAIACTHPSGLAIELVAARDTRAPWTKGGTDEGHAVRGLHSVTLTVETPARTVALFRELLGCEVVDETEGRIRVAAGGNLPGHRLDVVHGMSAKADLKAGATTGAARNGIGTVHHVALAISTADEQRRLREELIRYGCQVTEVRDRCYFESIYFREPGGVLIEVATVQPGFTVDETPGELGRHLKLPPWEEPHRPAIEAGLPEIRRR
jgi:glyoxalase family protein